MTCKRLVYRHKRILHDLHIRTTISSGYNAPTRPDRSRHNNTMNNTAVGARYAVLIHGRYHT